MPGLRVSVTAAAAVFFCLLLIPSAAAQVSVNDTLKIESVNGLPGDSVAVRIYLANSVDVGGIAFLLSFDSTYLSPIYIDVTDPLLNYQKINRGVNKLTNLLGNNVSSPDTNATRGHIVAGLFIIDPEKPADEILIGSGTFVQFWVRIKPWAPLGDSVAVRLFNEEFPGGRMNMLSDPDGLINVDPTLVRGYIRFKESVPVPNNPPYFTSPAAGQAFSVEQGQSVQFNVSAADDDFGQGIVLSMLSGPPGSTFPTVSGTGSVSSQFSWTTNFTHIGTYNATFQVVDDSNATATRTVTISVGSAPVEEDYLFTTSKSPGGFVEGGIPGARDVAVPVNLSDLNTLYGIEFDVAYNYVAMSLDSTVPTDRLEGFEVYSQSIGAGVVKVVTFGLDNEIIQPATSTSAIFYCWFTMRTTAIPGWYRFKLSNGRASLQPGQPSTYVRVDTLGYIAVDRLGDVNLDTLIDVGDLVTVVGYIIGNYELDARQFRAGNVNGDSEVNVVDLVAIINLIFTGGAPAPSPKPLFAGGEARLNLGLDDRMPGGYARLSLEADLPTEVAGLQFDLRYDPDDCELGRPELTKASDGFVLKYNELEPGCLRILLYCPSANHNRMIQPGVDKLVTVPVYGYKRSGRVEDFVTLEDAVLSDPFAREIPVARKEVILPSMFTLEQNYPNPFNPETRITFSINGDQARVVRLVVYNILGQEVSSLIDRDLAPGSYAVTWDGTDSNGRKQASGVYFYSLIVEDHRETRKMVLTK